MIKSEENIEYHNKLMTEALKLAVKSLRNDDVPVGAVVVSDGIIIGSGYNRIEKSKNSINHAETAAINQAVKKYGHKHLLNCDIYITLEPCSMCAGAIVLSRIKRVFIGADDPKTGAGGSVFNILSDLRLNHRCDVMRGVMEKECSELLKNFFKDLRKRK